MNTAKTPLPKPASLMFDLDGTLIDTMGGFADIAAECVEATFGMPRAEARQRYMDTSGIPFRHQLEVIFPSDPRNDATSDAFEHRKRSICEAADLDGPTVTALESLRERGIRLVVSSNSAQHYVDEFAGRAAFSFDLALGHGDGLGKGEPHVQRVCDTWSIARRQILFVGDSLKDGELAAETGVPFVGRTGTFTRNQFAAAHPGAPVIEAIGELLALIGDEPAAS